MGAGPQGTSYIQTIYGFKVHVPDYTFFEVHRREGCNYKPGMFGERIGAEQG